MERRRFVCYLLWFFAVLSVLQNVRGQFPNLYRLPGNTRPNGYDVVLTVDLDGFKFSGTVEIDLVAVSASNHVTLNIKELDISNVKLVEDTGRVLNIGGNVMQDDTEQVKFNLDSELTPERNYKLTIDFAGNITDDLKGLYKSSYYRETEERFVATTFNAAAYARKIFPCYDEPQLKAKFRLRVYHRPDFQVLSNMPVENRIESANSDKMSLTVFAESPLMSSYLFAFVVSDFEELRLDDKFAAHAQSSVVNSTRYALDFTKEAIEYLGALFKRPYQLSKLDIVAIDDFLMGAMENWGLITYKTSRIVYREGFDKTEKLQSVTKIVFHELIHQWFGNEATSAWWSYIWLNEGFADFLESYVLDRLRPEWRVMDQFLVNEMHPTMEKDVIPGTRPMTKPIDSPEQIAGIYDFVVYPKAASVIRMWQSILGAKVFDEFLVEYLADRSYKAATEGDMIRVLQSVVDRNGLVIPPVEKIVKSWTISSSFPVLTINRISANSAEVNAGSRNYFCIPVSWISQSKKAGNEWILDTENNKTFVLKDVGVDEWVLFNVNQQGYYRVNYDTKSWNLLVSALKKNHEEIPPLSRAQLIDDALILTRGDKVDIEVLLGLLEYIPKETDLIPLKAAFKALRYLDRLFRGNELYSNYLEFQSGLLDQVYDHMLKHTAEDHVSKLYRAEVRKIACELGVEKCLRDAVVLFEGFEKLEADLRASVICGAMKESESYTVWTLVLRRMTYIVRNFEQKRVNVEEFEDILYGLGCVVSNERLDNYMLLSLSFTETIEEQDRIKMFNYIANSGTNGTDLVLERLSTDYDTFKRRYGSMKEIISNLRYAISTEAQLQKYHSILRNNTDLDLANLMAEVHNEARLNVQWTAKNLPTVSKWISGHNAASMLDLSKLVLFIGFLTAFYQQ